ncbi:hypothetical protein NRK68_11140 [Streptomyces yangpuensis]|uniref:Uncharacterized protein n=1 Tax=Streptomyces yangpuensis TaxID=1648182 RepID=A0ABY5PUE8_9ACTN|nr:hypothetical protein [Streptomyces yangpuensis]UUY47729.1 hypothetical protein NRK68_11140 [Streptomyces yangpuensis]
MPEALRHDHHVDPGGEHQRRLPVPQVVQPHPPQPPALPVGQVCVVLEPDGVDLAAEELGDVIRAQGIAVMGEHEPVVPVRRLPLAALLLPPQLVTQERTDGQLVEVDDPVLTARRLGPGEHQTDVSPFAVRAGHGRHVPLLEPGHLHDRCRMTMTRRALDDRLPRDQSVALRIRLDLDQAEPGLRETVAGLRRQVDGSAADGDGMRSAIAARFADQEAAQLDA